MGDSWYGFWWGICTCINFNGLMFALLGNFKDHSFSEDYRNGRLDAMYGVMCQLGLEDDYDTAKGSYKAMKIKAVNE